MKTKYLPVKYQFSSEDEKKAMVNASEHTFSAELDRVIQRVLSDPTLPVLTLCGPSCSGKTTLCNRLTRALSDAGRQAKLISIDDFFLDREELNRAAANFGGEIDYDSVASLDLPTLEKCISELDKTGVTAIPHYDLHTGKRDSYRPVVRNEGDLLIFEGIQTLYPQFTVLIDSVRHLSVYTSVENGYTAAGNRFTPREIRFIRRIVRDFHFRNAPPQFTYYLWKSVCENEDQSIFPNSGKADLTVNTALTYELSAVKTELEAVLHRIPPESEYYETSRELLQKFEKIQPIDTAYIPEDSIFREFIG